MHVLRVREHIVKRLLGVLINEKVRRRVVNQPKGGRLNFHAEIEAIRPLSHKNPSGRVINILGKNDNTHGSGAFRGEALGGGKGTFSPPGTFSPLLLIGGRTPDHSEQVRAAVGPMVTSIRI